MSDNTGIVICVVAICTMVVSCGYQINSRMARVAEAQAPIARGSQQ